MKVHAFLIGGDASDEHNAIRQTLHDIGEMIERADTAELWAQHLSGKLGDSSYSFQDWYFMPDITPDTALVWLTEGEQITQFIVRDVVAFRAWLSANTDAADTQQLMQNDADYARAILHERAIAAGDGTGVR